MRAFRVTWVVFRRLTGRNGGLRGAERANRTELGARPGTFGRRTIVRRGMYVGGSGDTETHSAGGRYPSSARRTYFFSRTAVYRHTIRLTSGGNDNRRSRVKCSISVGSTA